MELKPLAKEVFSPAKPHAQKLKSTIKARFPTKLDQMGQKGSGRQALGVAYGGLVNGGESFGRDNSFENRRGELLKMGGPRLDVWTDTSCA